MAPTPEATPEATPEVTPEITYAAAPAPAMLTPTTTSVSPAAPTAECGSLADEPTYASLCAVYASTGGTVCVPATATAARDAWIVDRVAGRLVITITPGPDDNKSINAPVTGTRE